MKTILIITNPKAGKGKPLKALPLVEKYLTDHGFSIKKYLTIKTCDYTGISESILSHTNLYAIVIIGGDGTLNDVINSLPEKFETPLMVLPCGSGNDFANYLYSNKTTTQILSGLLNIETRPMDCGLCNGKRFINGLGIGFDGWVAGKANSGKKWLPSKLKYHAATFRGLFTYKSFYTSIGQSLLITIANGPTLGGGLKIAPGANPGDGKLDLWHIKPIPVLKRAYYFTLLKQGKHATIKGPYEHRLITELSIQSHKPLPAHLDGEYFESEKFEIRILEGFVKFII